MSAGRILVVGGSGFVGSRLLRLARSRGLAVASFGPGEAEGEDGVRRFAGLAEAPGALLAAMEAFAPDAVVWAAGHNPSGEGLARTALADPARAVGVNAGGFAAVLGACAELGVRRVVQCGSTVVYGPPGLYGPARVDEAAAPAPRTAYGLSKHMAELAADWGADALGLSVTTLRLPLVLGPGRWYVGAASLYARLLRAAALGADLDTVVPAAPFDALHGDDAAEALLLLAGMPDAPRRLNMAGLTLTYTDLAEALATLRPGLRLLARPEPLPPDLPLVDDARLRALGWAPRRGLEAILSETLREMMEETA
ncbi:NAD dependent epimerase/dehydratase family protein [Roseomonas rosea]|uniref:NAD dependent epimerase/dehydratase family protein n=1 Tax=Muricoccus roseus TaxID=198092 RepID=A0A1M6N0X8_9PROT|nr:NAD(P)-dependent oxidoreductase [Roseomonas rosea]SHJ89298.1 NAD dependent epimerase/dehydratase family protein [Roseomonas rosea]